MEDGSRVLWGAVRESVTAPTRRTRISAAGSPASLTPVS